MTPAEVSDLLRSRRSIFPKTYNDNPIDKAIIEEVLENANWAPTHKLTEPWRFKVFRGKALERLSTYLSTWYKDNIPAEKYSEKKFEKTKANPLRSSCVIAICMQRDPDASIPEWEEVAAVACAVQNMYLTCAAHNIGCYWSSPRSILEARDFLQLGDGESCLGLFYMGYHDLPQLQGKRQPISDKTVWWEE
ncbi:MAG: nitroreductase [Saprospiraceae bacterium]|nr:nitroreductase [Saprospiraceae bacterium]